MVIYVVVTWKFVGSNSVYVYVYIYIYIQCFLFEFQNGNCYRAVGHTLTCTGCEDVLDPS
jgi:hypothetical protein